MLYSTDRFEGELAVLISDEDESEMVVEKSMLPSDTEEGSVLRLTEDGIFVSEPEETERRRREFFLYIKSLTDKEK